MGFSISRMVSAKSMPKSMNSHTIPSFLYSYKQTHTLPYFVTLTYDAAHFMLKVNLHTDHLWRQKKSKRLQIALKQFPVFERDIHCLH